MPLVSPLDDSLSSNPSLTFPPTPHSDNGENKKSEVLKMLMSTAPVSSLPTPSFSPSTTTNNLSSDSLASKMLSDNTTVSGQPPLAALPADVKTEPDTKMDSVPSLYDIKQESMETSSHNPSASVSQSPQSGSKLSCDIILLSCDCFMIYCSYHMLIM